MALTEREIAALKPRDKNYRVADGHGLVVEVTTTGYLSFRYRYRFAGQLKMLVIGKHPDTKLADARRRAAEAREMLDKGVDPGAERRAEKERQKIGAGNTFESVGRAWYAKAKVRLSEATVEKHTCHLDRDVYPLIGNRPIADLTAADMLKVLHRIEQRGAYDIAARTFGLCGRIFRYGVALGYCHRDPTRDVTLRDVLHPPAVKHHGSVTEPKAIGELLRATGGFTGTTVVKCALRLAPYVFLRPGELRAGEWSEVDLDEATWRVPASRMKMKELHIVPLAPQAVAILRELHQQTGHGKFMFPSERTGDRCMSEGTVGAALQRMGYAVGTMTFHGYRSMASTNLHELGFPHEIIERQLAHGERNQVAAAYNYAQYLPARRAMMETWATWLDGLRIAV